jgi:hypothetical protein
MTRSNLSELIASKATGGSVNFSEHRRGTPDFQNSHPFLPGQRIPLLLAVACPTGKERYRGATWLLGFCAYTTTLMVHSMKSPDW